MIPDSRSGSNLLHRCIYLRCVERWQALSRKPLRKIGTRAAADYLAKRRQRQPVPLKVKTAFGLGTLLSGNTHSALLNSCVSCGCAHVRDFQKLAPTLATVVERARCTVASRDDYSLQLLQHQSLPKVAGREGISAESDREVV